MCPPIFMPRISSAADRAAAASSAALMPPALPRLPAGTWALTTTGPRDSAAAAASPGVAAVSPRGTAMPAAASSGFAACSSKSMGVRAGRGQRPWRAW